MLLPGVNSFDGLDPLLQTPYARTHLSFRCQVEFLRINNSIDKSVARMRRLGAASFEFRFSQHQPVPVGPRCRPHVLLASIRTSKPILRVSWHKDLVKRKEVVGLAS